MTQVAGLTIKGFQSLFRQSAANHHAALKLVEIIGMQWLANLEHHIVCDVNHERNRAHAGHLQPGDHPRWGWSTRIDIANGAQHKTINAISIANRKLVVNL